MCARLTAYGLALKICEVSLTADGGIDAWVSGTLLKSGEGPIWVQSGGADILTRLAD